jgi:hypothetical protein
MKLGTSDSRSRLVDPDTGSVLGPIVQPFRNQLTCPEITDEIAAMFCDRDVVLIATVTQLRKIKHFGIFLRKNGLECGSIQV